MPDLASNVALEDLQAFTGEARCLCRSTPVVQTPRCRASLPQSLIDQCICGVAMFDESTPVPSGCGLAHKGLRNV
jgi:hypothetical protein